MGDLTSLDGFRLDRILNIDGKTKAIDLLGRYVSFHRIVYQSPEHNAGCQRIEVYVYDVAAKVTVA